MKDASSAKDRQRPPKIESMPEFEVKLFNAQNKVFQTITIDAASEKRAVVKAAKIAKQNKASFFEVRRPLDQRWIKRT